MKPVFFFHEPEFFPSLQFFHGLIQSVVWVVLDHQTFQVRCYQNQCRIKTVSGIQVLRVAVKHPCNKPVYQTMIDNFNPWKRVFMSVIKHCYGRTEYYRIYIDGLASLINGPTVMLETLNVQTTMWIAGLLKAEPQLFHTHQFYGGRGSHAYPKHKVVESLCQRFHVNSFSQEFKHPFYQQSTGTFETDLSVLDALFNVGADETRKLLMNER